MSRHNKRMTWRQKTKTADKSDVSDKPDLPRPQKYKSGRYKTELCWTWQANANVGRCPEHGKIFQCPDRICSHKESCLGICSEPICTHQCNYGDTCRFAHGERDLRTPVHHKRYKTKMCMNQAFLETGNCSLGARCHFAHTQQELRQKKTGRTGDRSSTSSDTTTVSEFSSSPTDSSLCDEDDDFDNLMDDIDRSVQQWTRAITIAL
jgi:hypothetical protein